MPEVVGVERSRFLHVERWQGRASVRLLVVAASAVVAAGLLQLPQEPASAAVDARAVSPTELPPIPSDPAAPDVLDVPEGDSALDPAALSGAPAGVSVPAGALQPRPGQGGDGEVAVTEEALVADGARVVRREETFDVLEAADGTQTALISAGPRNVRVGEQFVPIETDVVRRGDALAARRHPLAPRFADRAGTVPLRLSVPGGGELTAQLLDDQTGDAPTGGPALDEPGEDVASPARETDPAPEQNGAVAELPAGPLPGQPDDGDRARAPPTLRAVAPVDPVVRDDEVRFPHVLDGTDLIYEVTPGGVKETVRLANRRAAARAGGSWTYRVGLSDGLSLQPGELDDVVVVDGKGQVRLVVPAVLAWDSSGIEGQRGPAETGGRLTVDRDEAGWLLTVSVDPRWLADPAREYPVLVDPGYFAATGATTTSTYNDSNNLRYKSDGYVSSDPQLRTGNPNQKDGTFYWQSTTQFNYSNLWSGANAAHGVDVVDAYVGVLYDGGGDDVARPMRLFQARPGGASGEAFNNYLPTTLAEGTFVYDGVLDGVATADGGDRLVQHLQQQVDARQVARLHFVGDEKPNVYSFKRFDAQLVVQWTDRSPQAPAASTATPGDGTYAQLRPTLRVGQVSDPEGDEVRYRFYVASGADGRTGTVAVSRWLTTPEWEVPPGVIRDGMPLRWTVSVSDWRGGLRHSRTAPWAKEYFVDQRVGSPDVAPVDSNGAWSVTLPNGNAHTTLSGPAMNQIGGPVAMTMTYNSQRDRRVVGLTGTYWEAAAGSAPGAPPADPSLVRQETSTVLDWGTSSPLPGVLAADGFRLRLTGFLTVPAGMSGQWLFGGYADDRLRVRVAQQNGALATAYDRWSFLAGGPHFQPDKPITLTAGQTYAIEVDYAEDGGGASLQLWADPPGASPPMVIPSTWLSPERPRALPSGWTLSTEIDGDPGYVSATPVAGGVAVLDGTGETHTWVATTLPAGLASSGQVAAYTPPKGQDGVLAQNADGTLTLHDADGTTFSFGADGRLTASATALEDRLPRTPQRILDGQGRLTELREPNENQWILRLRYQGGTTACPSASGFTTPPTGMLCKIDYRDGRSTEVFYDSSGRLTRVINPGSQVTDVGYENIQVRPGEVRSVMTSVRDPLTSDWVARDPANRTGPETRNVVAYSAAPGGTLALGTDQPVANVNRAVLGRAGEGRQIHRYGWQASGTTGTSRVYVEVDGLQPLPGQRARTVDYDPAGRPVRDIEATGRATTLRWDDRDRLLSTTDPAGRRTTTVYDRLDQPLETYGPAPTSCFTGDSLTPTASCASTIPRTSTAYDQGISGLAARYWNNPDQQGVPDERGTGVNRGGARTNTTPTMSHDWGAGAPAGITADRWSARWTGEITFPSTGTWRAVVAADDGVRVTVGDRVVFDRLKTTVGTSKVGPDFVVDTDPRTATTRRITVDYRDTGGAASFGLQFAKPGDGSTAFTPGAATSTGGLSARYGLPTTVTTYGTGSGGDAPDQTVRTVYDEPHTGLPSDVVEDPGGLALRTQTFYDALRRPVAREMPAHQGRPAGTGMAYRHAWVSRTVDDPCVTGTQDITQHGLPRYAFGPARNPDATSALQVRRVDETVYDSAGRVRATRTGEHTGVVPSDSSTSSDTIRTQTSWHGWLCTTYDDRDRPTRMTVPTNTSGIGTRIITTDYAVDGDPLRISTTDPRGTIRVELDVLGRTRSYTDVHGTVTTSDYDQPGRLVTSRTQPPSGTAATHTFAYDPAGRPTTHRYAAGGGDPHPQHHQLQHRRRGLRGHLRQRHQPRADHPRQRRTWDGPTLVLHLRQRDHREHRPCPRRPNAQHHGDRSGRDHRHQHLPLRQDRATHPRCPPAPHADLRLRRDVDDLRLPDRHP